MSETNSSEIYPKQIALGIADRIWLLNLLPREGDITTLKMLRAFREELSFTEDEHKLFELVGDGGAFKWNKETATDKIVSFGPKLYEIVVSTLKKLEQSKKLPEACIDLYEKFIQ